MSVLSQLAQYSSSYYYDDYSYPTTSAEDAAAGAALLIFVLITLFVVFLAYIFVSVCLMKVFKKAGRQDAWAAWIPIYNTYVYFEIAGRPGWWAFLGFIPFVGSIAAFIVMIIGSIDLAKSFGKEAGYGILLALLPIIGYPMLAFGDAQYQGPAGPDAKPQNQAPVAPPQPPQTPPVQPVV